MADTNYFAENLVSLREAAHLSQTEIEARTGIKRNTWSNWENEKSEPSMENIFKIAHFFSVDVGDLLSKKLSPEKTYKINKTIRMVREKDYGYQTTCKNCQAKEEIIELQKQTIAALQGQVEVLKKSIESTKKKD